MFFNEIGRENINFIRWNKLPAARHEERDEKHNKSVIILTGDVNTR